MRAIVTQEANLPVAEDYVLTNNSEIALLVDDDRIIRVVKVIDLRAHRQQPHEWPDAEPGHEGYLKRWPLLAETEIVFMDSATQHAAQIVSASGGDRERVGNAVTACRASVDAGDGEAFARDWHTLRTIVDSIHGQQNVQMLKEFHDPLLQLQRDAADLFVQQAETSLSKGLTGTAIWSYWSASSLMGEDPTPRSLKRAIGDRTATNFDRAQRHAAIVATELIPAFEGHRSGTPPLSARARAHSC